MDGLRGKDIYLAAPGPNLGLVSLRRDKKCRVSTPTIFM
jgi:hypothetical protein